MPMTMALGSMYMGGYPIDGPGVHGHLATPMLDQRILQEWQRKVKTPKCDGAGDPAHDCMRKLLKWGRDVRCTEGECNRIHALIGCMLNWMADPPESGTEQQMMTYLEVYRVVNQEVSMENAAIPDIVEHRFETVTLAENATPSNFAFHMDDSRGPQNFSCTA